MSGPKYNPLSYIDRLCLTQKLRTKLASCGFTQETQVGCKEEVYSLVVNRGIRVVVYTTIEGGYVRECGTDAIRVAAVYKTQEGGLDRGIAKAEKRVHRVGDLDEIVERMYQRMREVWSLGNKVERCGCCGAPKFLSKNMVCAELCWTKNGRAPRPVMNSMGHRISEVV